jgi:Ras-related protein Rab-2A
MDDNFKTDHQVTIGVEFGCFTVKMDEKVIKLQIWDTAGQESFRSITRIFYRGAHCVFLVYDMTRAETFNNVVEWLGEVKNNAKEDIVVYLIGNKADIAEGAGREVSYEQAIEFCKDQKIAKFFETSAKTGLNVEEVFSLASKELYKTRKGDEGEEQKGDPLRPTSDDENSEDESEEEDKKRHKLKPTKKPKPGKKQVCC